MSRFVLASACLFVQACDSSDSSDSACERGVSDLAADAPGASGFSGADVVEQVRSRTELLVEWQAGAAPAASTFEVAYGEIGSVAELTLSPLSASDVGCTASTWLEVSLPVDVRSRDGEVRASGTVIVAALDLERGDVFFSGAIPADVGGAYAEAVGATWEEVNSVELGFSAGTESGAFHRRATLDVRGGGENGGGVAAAFYCYSDVTPGCITW